MLVIIQQGPIIHWDIIVVCIHRLDENMVAKVGDFGFSRDVYISDYYRLDHSALLPVKWLAPEALFDKKFLTESDVVSGNKFIMHILKRISYVTVYST